MKHVPICEAGSSEINPTGGQRYDVGGVREDPNTKGHSGGAAVNSGIAMLSLCEGGICIIS